MGRSGGDSRAFTPPVADYRRKTGQFTVKKKLVEQKEIQKTAVAKKQALPIKEAVLALVWFGAVCFLLYMYLNYVLADDEFSEEEIAAAAAEAAAEAKAAAAAAAAKQS